MSWEPWKVELWRSGRVQSIAAAVKAVLERRNSDLSRHLRPVMQLLLQNATSESVFLDHTTLQSRVEVALKQLAHVAGQRRQRAQQARQLRMHQQHQQAQQLLHGQQAGDAMARPMAVSAAAMHGGMSSGRTINPACINPALSGQSGSGQGMAAMQPHQHPHRAQPNPAHPAGYPTPAAVAGHGAAPVPGAHGTAGAFAQAQARAQGRPGYAQPEGGGPAGVGARDGGRIRRVNLRVQAGDGSRAVARGPHPAGTAAQAADRMSPEMRTALAWCQQLRKSGQGPDGSTPMRKMRVHQVMVCHALECTNSSVCRTPTCADMKARLEHLKRCADPQCAQDGCRVLRLLLLHMLSCSNQECMLSRDMSVLLDRTQDRGEALMKHVSQLMDVSKRGLRRSVQRAIARSRTVAMAEADERRRRALRRNIEAATSAYVSLTARQIERHLIALDRDFSPHVSMRQLKSKLEGPLRKLIEQPEARDFLAPVDPFLLNIPNYFTVVQHPMDLGTVRRALDRGDYHHPLPFISDVRLVFKNAMAFNPQGHAVHNAARKMSDYFERLMSTARQQLIEQSDGALAPLDAAASGKQKDRCALCRGSQFKLEPNVYYCNACGSRVKTGYYVTDKATKRLHWCTSCAEANKWRLKAPDGRELARDQLVKEKCPEAPEEPWVQCDFCSGWLHQACGLFNGRRNEAVDARDVHYRCPRCISKELKKLKHPGPIGRKAAGARAIPHTELSRFLERRVRDRVRHEVGRQRRAEAMRQRDPVYVKAATGLIVRVVASTDKNCYVKPGFAKHFCERRGFPQDIPYRSRCILLFQEMDGVEVLLFGMYVQEYDEQAHGTNARSVYIAYLDSAKYLRPAEYRTPVYQELLIGYLAFVKQRGFTSCFIWSCPPMKGDDYILYCHPEEQRTPRPERLRHWYYDMIDTCVKEGIVLSRTTLLHEYMSPKQDPAEVLSVTRLPYFDGDCWPGLAEELIADIKGDVDETPPPPKKRRTGGAPTLGPSAKAALRGTAPLSPGFASGLGAAPWAPGTGQASGGATAHAVSAAASAPAASSTSAPPAVSATAAPGSAVPPTAASAALATGFAATSGALSVPGQAVGGGAQGAAAQGAAGGAAAGTWTGTALAASGGDDGQSKRRSRSKTKNKSKSKSKSRGKKKGGGGSQRKRRYLLRLDPHSVHRRMTPLMDKLISRMDNMKEDFIVCHMQPKCAVCDKYVMEGSVHEFAPRDEGAASEDRGYMCDACYRAVAEGRVACVGLEEAVRVHCWENKVPAACKDEDDLIDSEIFDTRQSFLTLCQGNHYQFDLLRRAKHSTMMVLYHLHNPNAPSFVHSCNNCTGDITTGHRYHCETCQDFDLCEGCAGSTSHAHPLQRISVEWEGDQSSKALRLQEQRHLLRRMGEELGHAAQCTGCTSNTCSRLRLMLEHQQGCSKGTKGKCRDCVQLDRVIHAHAGRCRDKNCAVPGCSDLKDQLRQQHLQQTAHDARRRRFAEDINDAARNEANPSASPTAEVEGDAGQTAGAAPQVGYAAADPRVKGSAAGKKKKGKG